MEGLTFEREALVDAVPHASSHQLSRRSFLAGLGVAAGGLALAACGVAPAAIRRSTTGQVELLAILDLSGPLAPLGRQMAAGAALAVADVNSSAGVLGRHISLVVVDSGSDLREFQRLAGVAQRAGRYSALVVGPLGQISAGTTVTCLRAGPDLGAPPAPHELRASSSLATQAMVLGRYARDKSASRMHLLVPELPWLDTSRLAPAVAASSNLSVVGASTVSLAQAGFSRAIDEIGRSGADCVLCLVPGAPQLALLEQLAASPLHGRVLVLAPSFGAGGEQVVAGARGAGVVTASPYFAGVPGGDAAWAGDVATRLHSPSVAVGDAAASAWLACTAWATLVRQAASLDASALRGATTIVAAPEGRATVDTSLHRVRRTVAVGLADGKGGFSLQPALAAEDSVPAWAAPGARS